MRKDRMETPEERTTDSPVVPEQYLEPQVSLPSEPVQESSDARPPEPSGRRSRLPLILFLATCLSTWWAGGLDKAVLVTMAYLFQPEFDAEVLHFVTAQVAHGLIYAVAVMVILLAHEFGHFLQARRYGVPASLPFFIPMPFGPTGTMGAVILMRPGGANRKALFDIAITGPLAGLVPSILLTVVGLKLSHVISLQDHGSVLMLGEPLLFRLLSDWFFGPLSEGTDIILHPLAFAGWVGTFITALNLVPIGQLDGGHILYALLRRKAHPVAVCLLGGAAAAVFLFRYWGWSVMLALLIIMGPKHPPTADDDVPLGPWRVLLGWLILLFVPLGFTPTPFSLRIN